VIVRTFPERIELITQPDHAQLAGQIIERHIDLASRSRRASILRATAEHDSGWIEVDAAPIVNPGTGEVVDFVHAPLDVRQRAWRRAAARLADDAWAAALVAHHALTAYERFRSHTHWETFFQDTEAVRENRRQASGLALDTLVADYAFLRLGDLISLAFCTGSTDSNRFADWTIRLSGDRVVVTPDPFGGAVVPFEVSARVIPNQRFRSNAALQDALQCATVTTLRGETAGWVALEACDATR
jgi:hypothetical protein